MHRIHACVQSSTTSDALVSQSKVALKLLTGCKSHHASTFFCPQYHFAVIFDTSQLSGENDTLQFLVQAKR